MLVILARGKGLISVHFCFTLLGSEKMLTAYQSLHCGAPPFVATALSTVSVECSSWNQIAAYNSHAWGDTPRGGTKSSEPWFCESCTIEPYLHLYYIY